MKTVILKGVDGKEYYINPDMVEVVDPSIGDENRCNLNMQSGDSYTISMNAHLVATILATQPTRPDKFISYKDYDWK